MDGIVTFQYDNNNGIYTLGSGVYSFDTRWSRCGNDLIYAYGLIGFRPDVTTFPKPNELITFNYSSNVRTVHAGQVVIFENMNRQFAAVKVCAVKSSIHGNFKDEITFEYHIYVSL